MTERTKFEKKFLKKEKKRNFPSRFSDLAIENKRTCKNFSIKKLLHPPR